MEKIHWVAEKKGLNAATKIAHDFIFLSRNTSGIEQSDIKLCQPLGLVKVTQQQAFVEI